MKEKNHKQPLMYIVSVFSWVNEIEAIRIPTAFKSTNSEGHYYVIFAEHYYSSQGALFSAWNTVDYFLSLYKLGLQNPERGKPRVCCCLTS